MSIFPSWLKSPNEAPSQKNLSESLIFFHLTSLGAPGATPLTLGAPGLTSSGVSAANAADSPTAATEPASRNRGSERRRRRGGGRVIEVVLRAIGGWASRTGAAS